MEQRPDGGENHNSADEFYDGFYEAVLNEGGTGRAVALAHKQIERGISRPFPRVLELGAGSGQHRPYVTHPYELYLETDIAIDDTPTERSEGGRTIRRERADALALPYDDAAFDRLIATCLLIHLPEPERALAEWRRVVRPGGLLTIYVPCDPGLVLRLTRHFTTARKSAKLGYDGYALMNAREHSGHVGGLDVRIRHFFASDTVTVHRWPFRLRTWNFNYFFVYNVHVADTAERGPGTA